MRALGEVRPSNKALFLTHTILSEPGTVEPVTHWIGFEVSNYQGELLQTDSLPAADPVLVEPFNIPRTPEPRSIEPMINALVTQKLLAHELPLPKVITYLMKSYDSTDENFNATADKTSLADAVGIPIEEIDKLGAQFGDIFDDDGSSLTFKHPTVYQELLQTRRTELQSLEKAADEKAMVALGLREGQTTWEEPTPITQAEPVVVFDVAAGLD